MSVLFITSNMLPNQSASSTRVLSLAKAFKLCGEEPILLGIRYSEEIQLEGLYDGIKYMHIDAAKYYSVPKYKRTKFVVSLAEEKIQQLWNQYKFRIIVVSGFDRQSISFVLKFAKKHKVFVIINSVEWYEKNNEVFDGITGSVKYIYNRYGMMVEHVKAQNIIGISTLLTSFYKNKNCNTVRIPTIVDIDKYKYTEKNRIGKTVIAYAGAPARKDYIGNAIKALLLLNENERNKIELHLYGVDEKELQKSGITSSQVSELNNVLFAHGRIPHEQVYEKISAADFTVLLRPNLRYANAGFPTKVGESMMCGTPVIANITSDLGLYIKDNITGIVLENESSAACAEGFKRILDMDNEALKNMRINARKEAEKSFCYDVYKCEIQNFIDSLKYSK